MLERVTTEPILSITPHTAEDCKFATLRLPINGQEV